MALDRINNQNAVGSSNLKNGNSQSSGGSGFEQLLKESVNELNQLQIDGEKALSDIATGQVKDLHQAALAINKAESSMKLMLEVRNKAISAYKELLRTQM